VRSTRINLSEARAQQVRSSRINLSEARAQQVRSSRINLSEARAQQVRSAWSVNMTVTTINNISLYYEQHGTGDDLILIGGLTSDHQVWKSPLRELSKHFRVLIFDNRGAGQTSAPDYPYTLEMMATDTLQLMDALQIKRAHILGHSMGGAIAMQMALTAKERINKLILVCSRFQPNAVSSMIFSMRNQLIENHFSDQDVAKYMMPFLFGDEFLNNKMLVNGFLHWTVKNPFPQTPHGYRHQLEAIKNADFSDEVHRIDNSTLIIAGDQDILSRSKKAELLSTSFKNSTFVELADCGHMPHVEKSTEFTQLVMNFFNDVSEAHA
jgi:3-oxoadipate enol-lactonase